MNNPTDNELVLKRRLHQLADQVESSMDTNADSAAPLHVPKSPQRPWLAAAAVAALVGGGAVLFTTTHSSSDTPAISSPAAVADQPPLPGNDAKDEKPQDSDLPELPAPQTGAPTEEILAIGELVGAPEILEWVENPGGGWRATYSATPEGQPSAEVSIGTGPDMDDVGDDLGQFLLPGSKPTNIAGVEQAFIREDPTGIGITTFSGVRNGKVLTFQITVGETRDTERVQNLYSEVVKLVSDF